MALNTYLEAIPPHAPPDAEWLGTKELYTESYLSVLQSISSTVQGKAALAKYGAISQNPSCTKCFLLADFEWLGRFAENGVLPLFDPQTGRPIADAQTSRQVTVSINGLYFDAIKKSHKRVQEWKVKEEAFLLALRKPTLIGSSFDEQRKKRLEADTAKHEAVLELHRNNELVPTNMRQRFDLAVEFASQRNAYCDGDFTIQAKP